MTTPPESTKRELRNWPNACVPRLLPLPAKTGRFPRHGSRLGTGRGCDATWTGSSRGMNCSRFPPADGTWKLDWLASIGTWLPRRRGSPPSATPRPKCSKPWRGMRRPSGESVRAPGPTPRATGAMHAKHMLDAAGAVPCWIMSHAKVSESMPAGARRIRPRHRRRGEPVGPVGAAGDPSRQEDSGRRRRQAGVAGRRVHLRPAHPGTEEPAS